MPANPQLVDAFGGIAQSAVTNALRIILPAAAAILLLDFLVRRGARRRRARQKPTALRPPAGNRRL